MVSSSVMLRYDVHTWCILSHCHKIIHYLYRECSIINGIENAGEKKSHHLSANKPKLIKVIGRNDYVFALQHLVAQNRSRFGLWWFIKLKIVAAFLPSY